MLIFSSPKTFLTTFLKIKKNRTKRTTTQKRSGGDGKVVETSLEMGLHAVDPLHEDDVSGGLSGSEWCA